MTCKNFSFIWFKTTKIASEPTAKIWCECLSLVSAEEALLPEHRDLGADGVCDVTDVVQLQFLQMLNLCL